MSFANGFKPDTLQMWLGNSFKCSLPMHGVCILLNAYIEHSNFPDQTIQRSELTPNFLEFGSS